MTTQIYQVDAFTDTPFKGNPAAVCLLNEPHAEKWMQQVAMEMNLSETAFLWPLDEGYSLRWFTPTIEVDLCGHATLASAHILWQTGMLRPTQTAVFHTKSGQLTAKRDGDWIEMNFPATPPETAELPQGLQAALGVDPIYTGRFGDKYLVVIEGENKVRLMQPDFAAMRKIDARAVCVTSRAETKAIDFVSRYFVPWISIDEDPVTGSAHCCLTPYWAEQLGKENLTAYQASARGGLLQVQPIGNRVLIRGQATTILSGELLA